MKPGFSPRIALVPVRSTATHLKRLIKPAVPAIPAAPSAVQHLRGHAAAVDVVRDPGHRGVQADGEDALLDGTHGLFVGLVWVRDGGNGRHGSETGTRLRTS